MRNLAKHQTLSKPARNERRSGRQRHRLFVVRGDAPNPAVVSAHRIRARFDRARVVGWDALLRPAKRTAPVSPSRVANEPPAWWTARVVGYDLARIAVPVSGVTQAGKRMLWLHAAPEHYHLLCHEVQRIGADALLGAVNRQRAGEPPFHTIIQVRGLPHSSEAAR